MTSRKEEERNERIIRGLMKLPPNRRCINCNSLGPQYVCTNFQTFVCMTCSGIHREFTHRVKSVSMSKFTKQEVEALQEGGNQRARETFLKDWDPRNHKLPDSSNADKVRDFIKSVYVERKYSGMKTSDKPPRDIQNLRNHEDETRRASSYHSYSQSPPYDYQYEERRYGEKRHGKHAPSLSRKPGSDRGNYGGRILSFLSPSRLSDHVHEDRFASEGSSARASDYSVSSGGDPFKSGIQSPTFPTDNRFSSPTNETSRDILGVEVQHHKVDTFLDVNGKRDVDQVLQVQRNTLSDSSETFSRKSVFFKSVDAGNEKNVVPALQEPAPTHPNAVTTFSSLPQSSRTGNSDGLELFNAPFVPSTVTSTASVVDLFQLPDTSSTSPIDFFQPFPTSMVLTSNSDQQPQEFSPSSLDLFSAIPHPQSAAILTTKSPDLVIEKNEGWATFDVPQHMKLSQSVESSNTAVRHSTNKESLGNVDLSQNENYQWSYPDSNVNRDSSSLHNPWNESLQNFEAPLHATSNQSWSAFDNSTGHIAFQGNDEQSNGPVAVQTPSFADKYMHLGTSENNQIQRAVVDGMGSVDASSTFSFMAGSHNEGVGKSNNPFDLPCDSEYESSNTFLDMTAFQAVLPDYQMPNSFISGMAQPWFPEDSALPYIPAGPQGALGFMSGQASSRQISNIPSPGPVASVGGNPFD